MARNNVEIVVTAEDKASGVLRGISGAAGSIAKVAGGAALGGIAALAGGFALAGGAAISMNAQLETSTLQFETLMGDAGRAEEHVRSLFDFAAKTPFETGPIIEASRLMQVFGGDALNTNDNLTRIGNTAAAVGAPIEDIGFWVGRAYAAIQGGQPFGEAAQNLMQMGAVSPAVIQEMKDLEAAGASADEIFAVLQGHMDGFTGAMEKQAGTWEGLKSTIVDNLNMAAATALEPFFELAQGGLEKFATWLSSPEIQTAIETFATKLGEIVDSVSKFVTEISDGEDPVGAFANLFWRIATLFGASEEQGRKLFMTVRVLGDRFKEFIDRVVVFVTTHGPMLKNILIGVGVGLAALSIIGTVVGWVTTFIGVVSGLAATFTAAGGGIAGIVALLGGPVTIVIAAVAAAIGLLVVAWRNNWGGIQEKTAAAWAVIQPLLQQAWDWLQTNIPLALETLRSWWVDTAWPAIQTAIETVWPVIEGIFQSIRDWVMNTLIPTVQDLYQKWTTEWWPTIQTVLENVWTVIEEILTELHRWFNDNIIPIVEALYNKWVNDWWPAIEKALTDAWAEIKPVLQNLWDKFKEVMSGLQSAIQPALDLWNSLVDAVKTFWSWISSTTFSFNFSIPDLPDWITGDGKGRSGGRSTGRMLGTTIGGVAAATNTSRSLTVNVDARGAARGVDRDVRAAVEQVLREYGMRADLRMRTG